MSVTWTAKQAEAKSVIADGYRHMMLYGGSRSGKTFLLVWSVVLRALKAPNSRHLIARFRFNACKASVLLDTFPKVLRVCFPGVKCTTNKTDWYVEFENGSQIWFAGLDDKERTEKILGMEFVTVYLNECSQIPYESAQLVKTRLAQRVEQSIKGRAPSLLTPRMFYDCNPPAKSHWTYVLFVKKVDPADKTPVRDPESYGHFRINPTDNLDNIDPDYVETTLKSLSARQRLRFLAGEFEDANPNALFNYDDIERWRVLDGDRIPDFVRVSVGIDPSGADDDSGDTRDAIGIVVGALGTDGNAYLLEDLTVTAGPATWGRIAVDAYERHGANVIVGETNYGGAMVQHVVRTAKRGNIDPSYKAVTATRGKQVRAEPFAALYEQGRIRHTARFAELEDEILDFGTHGYTGSKSPNRADAWFWVLADLFGGMVAPKAKPLELKVIDIKGLGSNAWQV